MKIIRQKKQVKNLVSDAKSKAYDDIYKKLSTKVNKEDIFKLTRMREMKSKDLYIVTCKEWSPKCFSKGQYIKGR